MEFSEATPASAIRPAGQDLGAPLALGIDDSTALLAAKCQYFLDNVIAQFGGIGAYNNRDGRRIVMGSNGCADIARVKRTWPKWRPPSWRLRK
jgi:hypothetical protein